MQMIARLLLLLAAAGAARVGSPVGKVLELMSGLEATIVKETEEAAKLKAEKDTWCKDTAVNLGFEIKTGTDEVAELEAKIAKELAAIGSLTEKIGELVGQIAKDDKDLQAATKIRAEEVSDFEAEEKELAATIDTLQRAIGVLERELSKAGSAALVQVQSANTVVQALEVMVKAAMFSQADASRLTAFVQSTHQSSDGDAGAPDAAVYESKSGGIVDVLEDLLDKAQTQLADARSKEAKAQHAFEMLKQSLEDSIAYGTKDMEAAKSSKAKAGEEKSAAEGSLADVSRDLAEDKVMLGDVEKDCAAHAEAIIEETTGDAAAIALPQTPAASFLQVRRGRRAAHDAASAAAVRAVRALARGRRSPALAQLVSRLASAVRMSAAEGEDPFEKVKGLITDMIAKLEKESSEEAEQKAYCDKEMKDAEDKKAEKSDTVEKLTTKIDQAKLGTVLDYGLCEGHGGLLDSLGALGALGAPSEGFELVSTGLAQMAAGSAKLKDSVATLEKELAELAETQVQMDKMRKEESALFAEQDKSLKDGIAGVEGALKILKDYYAKEDKAHDANEGAAGGIIGMLEVCLSDFTKGLAEITAAEDAAQSEYEVTTQDNKEAKVAKEQSVKYETKEAAELDKAISEATADRATTQSELEAVLEYFEKLQGMCVAKPETYEQRAERRSAEIAGLKKALEILS